LKTGYTSENDGPVLT